MARTGMPGSNPSYRLAGAPVEESPGFRQMVLEALGMVGSQSKDAVKGVTQGAKGMNQGLARGLLANSGKLAAGTGALALIGAATEFADPDDPVLRNAAEAAGNFTFGTGGALTGAALGSMILPGIGTLVGAGAGGYFGSRGGAGLAGGLYDLMTNESPGDRARRELTKNAATQRQIEIDDATARIPIQADLMELKRDDAFQRAERELKIQNEYNYANAVNQAMLNAQQQASLQNLALTQYMMS